MSANEQSTALVTGGSTGIGADICTHLLDAGYEVLNLARRGSPAEHKHLHDFHVDLSDVQAARAIALDIASKFQVTTLIHNAGVIRPDLVANVKQDDLEYLVHLHLSSLLGLTQVFLPTMRAHAFGRIVVISSRAIVGLETRTAYSATKAAQIGMMRTWAMELAKDGITVNAVAPGPIVTDMFHELIPADSPKKEQLANGIPVGRLGQPDDVSRAVMFLVAPENSFVTGQTLFVCGGTSLGSLSIS